MVNIALNVMHIIRFERRFVFDMADSQIFKSHPEYLIFIEGFRNPSIDVPVPAWEPIKDGIYEEGLHRVMNGELTIDEFLQMIEDAGR